MRSHRVVQSTDELLSELSSRRHYLLSDLSRGTGQSHSLARELIAQLPCEIGLPLQHHLESKTTAVTGGFGFAQIAAQGIDAESQGDISAKLGVCLAAAIKRHAKIIGDFAIYILIRDEHLRVSSDNLNVLRYLRKYLSQSKVLIQVLRVNVPAAVAKISSTQSLGRLIPGIIHADLAECLDAVGEELSEFIELPNGDLLQPLEWMQIPQEDYRNDFDRLASLPKIPEWAKAYGQLFGNHHFIDRDFLIERAWTEFSAGGRDLAFKLLDRASEGCRDSISKAVLQCHMQGMRIADLRFDDLADVQVPPESLPIALQAFLLIAKGWGCILRGRAAEGEKLLVQAQRLKAYESQSLEGLYLKNIRALARYRQNDPQQALIMEKEIEQQLARSDQPDAQLTYVNAINLARVHTARGEYRSAEAQFKRAFTTVDGVMTESDLLYFCICLGRAAEARRDVNLSFRFWLQAALYWLSNPYQEAICRRLAAIITGQPWVDPETAVLKISEALDEGLRRVSTRRLIYFESNPMGEESFVRAFSSDESLDNAEMVGDNNCFVIQVNDSVKKPIFNSGSRQFVNRVGQIIRQIFSSHSMLACGHIFLPFLDGYGFPTTKPAAISECLRLGLSRARIEGRKIIFTGSVKRSLEESLLVKLNPNTSFVDGDRDFVEVGYGRHRRSEYFSGPDAMLVCATSRGDETKVKDLYAPFSAYDSDPDQLLPTLRALEQRGVIHLCFEEAPCIPVGG